MDKEQLQEQIKKIRKIALDLSTPETQEELFYYLSENYYFFNNALKALGDGGSKSAYLSRKFQESIARWDFVNDYKIMDQYSHEEINDIGIYLNGIVMHIGNLQKTLKKYKENKKIQNIEISEETRQNFIMIFEEIAKKMKEKENGENK